MSYIGACYAPKKRAQKLKLNSEMKQIKKEDSHVFKNHLKKNLSKIGTSSDPFLLNFMNYYVENIKKIWL